jgi:hypothetical protein
VSHPEEIDMGTTLVHAHHSSVKRLGNWTTARAFEVRAQRGTAVLDLRSPDIPAGDIEVRVDLERAMLKLLVPDGATIDHWDLAVAGRGRVKDAYGHPTPGGRVIRIVGRLAGAEIRVHRSGVAILSAMCSKEYVADLRRAHREGRLPTVDDPTRPA